MSKHSSYTLEETEKIISLYYDLGNDGLEEIAREVNKSINSIRAKLVWEKVYEPSEKIYSTKKSGPSKKDIFKDLESLGLNTNGLDGATKPALLNIKKVLEELQNDS